jgi:hypothetical protein
MMIFFENEGQKRLSGFISFFKANYLLRLESVTCYQTNLVVVVLVIILKAHVVNFRILRRLAYTTLTDIDVLLTTGSVAGSGALVRLTSTKFSKLLM